jgi:hypothetical protein
MAHGGAPRREAYRVLKKGGLACMIGPVHPTFWLSSFFADAWMLFPTEQEYLDVRSENLPHIYSKFCAPRLGPYRWSARCICAPILNRSMLLSSPDLLS